MRTILFLVQKEFLQIFRNKGILPVIFILPVIQLMVLSFAVDFEIKNLKFYWIDQDQSTSSRLLRQKLEASSYFQLVGSSFSSADGDLQLSEGTADLVIHLPPGFEKQFLYQSRAPVQLIVNAIDGTKAGLAGFYASQVMQDWAGELRARYGFKGLQPQIRMQRIDATYSFWFNPELDYKTFMVPGILVLLVTMIGVFVSSMNIVREKELGTIEQLNVSPIRKYQFIAGKLIPLWLIGLFEFSLGLFVARMVFHIPIEGSLFLLYAFTAIYLFMVLGLGMLISTLTDTQQQAMFVSWFFLVIFILMSGLFTPIENMPVWAQKITLANPIRYFIEVVRMLMLKGARLSDISGQFLTIFVYAWLINGLAIWRYRKTT